ncbi:hypothetical protein BTVI_85260 [Pitangus sulphuratus]|nr:hypothetical protein BTVI_85260 [Pitangus sulphuratus]
MDSNSNTVVVTGFGPFRQYLVNSSWEAVKELSKRGLGENINLQVMQLPVVYQKAKEQVIKIWTTLQPLVGNEKVMQFLLFIYEYDERILKKISKSIAKHQTNLESDY